MTTAGYSCHTCNDSDFSSGQYKTVKTYMCEKESTTVIKSVATGKFKSVGISEKKKRIRELNKLVSKWR